MRDLKESDIQKQIIDYLEMTGNLVVKINNVGIMKPNGSFIPPRQRGVSDLLVCKRGGHFVAIEVKVPGNKPTLYQSNFIEDVKRRGGRGFVANSLNDVINNF